MCVVVVNCVGNSRAKKKKRSLDMAGLSTNVTDSAGRSGMDSSPWLSHPQMVSSFKDNGQGQGALRRYPVLRKPFPMCSYFSPAQTALSGRMQRYCQSPDVIMLKQAGKWSVKTDKREAFGFTFVCGESGDRLPVAAS